MESRPAHSLVVISILAMLICLLCSFGEDMTVQCRESLIVSWRARQSGTYDEAELPLIRQVQLGYSVGLLAGLLWNQDGVERWEGCVEYEDDPVRSNPHLARYPAKLDSPEQLAGNPLRQIWGETGHTDVDAYPGFYANPYTASGMADFNAQAVPFGWTEQAVGNFTYLTQRNAAGLTDGFMLIGWGPDEHAGLDLDGDGESDGAVVILASELLRDHGWHTMDMWAEESLHQSFTMLDGESELQLIWPGQHWREFDK
jgi:hypothetical protein